MTAVKQIIKETQYRPIMYAIRIHESNRVTQEIRVVDILYYTVFLTVESQKNYYFLFANSRFPISFFNILYDDPKNMAVPSTSYSISNCPLCPCKCPSEISFDPCENETADYLSCAGCVQVRVGTRKGHYRCCNTYAVFYDMYG